MRTTISPGQWQPWTAVSPLLGLINIAQPSSQWTGDPVSQREISNKASNVASRSELGRLPLIINIYKNFPYFILYLLRKNEDKLLLNKPFVPRKSFTIMVKIAFTIILSKYLNILTCPILILII